MSWSIFQMERGGCLALMRRFFLSLFFVFLAGVVLAQVALRPPNQFLATPSSSTGFLGLRTIVDADVSAVTTLPSLALPSSQITGVLQAAQEPAHIGDVTNSAGSLSMTLATVNSNAGSFGGTNSIPTFTVNAKGLITAASGNVPSIPFTELTGSAACAQLPALTGNVTTPVGSCVTTIPSGTITNSMQANEAANSFRGNNTGSPAPPSDLTLLQTSTALKDVINAKLYGVVGNGIADDTTALQNAINAAQVAANAFNGPSTLYIPAGAYKITSPLTVNQGLSIIGDGRNSTVLEPSGNMNAINITTINSLTLSNFNITYQGAQPTSATTITISASGNFNIATAIRDVEINNAFNGIALVNVAYSVIDHVSILTFAGDGVTYSAPLNPDGGDNIIDNSIFFGNISFVTLGSGVTWISGGGLKVENTKLVSGGTGSTRFDRSMDSGIDYQW